MANIEQESIRIVANSFDLELAHGEGFSLSVLRKYLIERLNYLINNDLEKLLWVLYRIDVDEKVAIDILSDKNNRQTAATLADVIIQRQIEKIKTRLKYKGEEDNNSTEKEWG